MKDRIEYIDAMRGLAMFMVVVYHITFGCFHSDNIITKIVNVQLELPLFFFISGFFANKMSRNGFRKAIVDKFSYLVVPALIMMAIYCWVMDFDFFEGLQKRLKEGYWFTLVLFEFIVIFLCFEWIGEKLNMSPLLKKYLHLFVGIILIYVASFSEKHNAQYPIINTFTIGEFGHYIYFVLGMIFFSMYGLVYNLLKNKWILGGVISAYIIADILRYKYGFACLRLGAMVSVSVLILLGLLIIWGTFLHYEGLSKGTLCGRFLHLLGRRSLDVYFIHYFILPFNMPFVGKFFEIYHNPFIEYSLAVGIAILVTLASLGIGCIVRLSPILARWLLGVNQGRETTNTI